MSNWDQLAQGVLNWVRWASWQIDSLHKHAMFVYLPYKSSHEENNWTSAYLLLHVFIFVTSFPKISLHGSFRRLWSIERKWWNSEVFMSEQYTKGLNFESPLNNCYKIAYCKIKVLKKMDIGTMGDKKRSVDTGTAGAWWFPQKRKLT